MQKPFPINLLINKNKIPAVIFFKDLGIYKSENLKWNEHVNYLYKIAQIHLIKYLKVLKPVLLVFIQNYLKYTFALNLNTIPQYGPPILKKDIIKMEYVERNFTCFVCNRCNISNTSYKDRLVKLGLESLEYRRWQFDLITLFKIVKGKHEELFKQFLVFSQTN